MDRFGKYYYLEKSGLINQLKSAGENIIRGIFGKLFPKEVELITKHPEQALEQIVRSKINMKDISNNLINAFKSEETILNNESVDLLVEKINWQKIGDFLNKYKGPILLALIMLIFLVFGMGHAQAADLAQHASNLTQHIGDKADLLNQISYTITHSHTILAQVPYQTGLNMNGATGVTLNIPEADQIKYVHNIIDYFKSAGLPDSEAIHMSKNFFISHMPDVDIHSKAIQSLTDLGKIGKEAGSNSDAFVDMMKTSSQLFDNLISKIH
jgi:hypothetical protein